VALNRRTYRDVDGERIEGTWRPIFIRNGGSYFLTDLLVYADGAIHCWEWVDLDGLRQKLASGWVATSIEPGAEGSAHSLASWRFEDPQMWVTAEELLGEVADEIDQLNDRPDSTDRCLLVLDRYLLSRAESDRQDLRAAYLAIPEHVRHYALGDMDAKDWPLEVLSREIGERTAEEDADAHEYFEDRERSIAEWRDSRPNDGPDQPGHPTVSLASIPGRFPAEPGIAWLRNEYPTPIIMGGATYPSAVHAYWSLATTDETVRAAIRAAGSPFSVESAVGTAPLRDNWPELRLTAMHAVLRAKFGQHPELADLLVATGDARIDYSVTTAYWSSGAKGRSFLGRLLELVRSEIVAQRSGMSLPPGP
jgi:predicted NAD-dependent protein-ADP-ribosyltransferase YbiA (DUF1768 family)